MKTDELVNRLREHAEWARALGWKVPICLADDLEAAVDKLTAYDIAPVQHSAWNADESCKCCGKKSTEGLDAEKWNYWFPKFCPNCGAKMDAED